MLAEIRGRSFCCSRIYEEHLCNSNSATLHAKRREKLTKENERSALPQLCCASLFPNKSEAADTRGNPNATSQRFKIKRETE